ncbi:MAG: peroxiredoxin-like family protein [Mariprofundaceae bacterium]
MNLTQQLEDFKQQMSGQLQPEVLATMQQAGADLKCSGIDDQALKAGDMAPDFDLPELAGDRVRLVDVLKNGPVVISFYRGAWCPYCNLEMQALQAALPEIERVGGQLIAIAPELPEYAGQTRDKGNLTFPLLHDRDNILARKFGLVFALPAVLRSLYEGFSIDLAASQGNDDFELPMPATYIVGKSGTIAHAFVDSDYTQRMEPSKIIDILKDL